MESPKNDIDFLAKETFALSEALKGSEEFGQTNFFDDFQLNPINTPIEVPFVDNHYSFFPDIIVELPELPVELLEEAVASPIEEVETVQFLEEQEQEEEEELDVEISLERETEVDSAPFPVAPGLVFKLDQNSSTFCVRGIKTFNINETIHDLMCEDEKLIKRLKITEEADFSNVHYFETKSIEQAEIISDYIVNRRFPIHEEMVCNLSDPGFSWWYESIDSGFKVFFKAQSVERDQDFIRLGPIGDRGIASAKLASCEALLRKFFSIAEYSSTEKSFEIKAVNGEDENFLLFKSIFENGSFDFDLDIESLSLEHQRLVMFLEEMAAVRGFWISIEDLLA